MKININELSVGMILKQPIYRSNGILVLKEGTELTERMITLLKALKVEYAIIDSSKAEQTTNSKQIEETVNLETRSEMAKSLETFLENPNSSNMQDMKENTKKIVKTIEDNEKFNYDLESYISQKDIHAHSVRVTCFSIVLAKIYNAKLKKSYPNSSEEDLIDLEDIAIAALLHDIGVACRDSEKLKQIKEIPNLEDFVKQFPGLKNTPLDQYDAKYTSVYSYCLVGNTDKINQKAKTMILLSNEPESEKGCLKVPFHVNSQSSPDILGGKIIRTCDIYDKVMNSAIEKGISLEDVASILGYCAQNSKISREMEQILINNLPLYPIGTKVKLSNGKFAIVKESFVGPYDSYKPVVETFNGQIIDLRDFTTITIESIIDKEELCKKIMKYQINVTRKDKEAERYQDD